MIQDFSNDKKTFLAKLDKSKKGEIDAKVLPLLNAINGIPNYYTTSSCSGRVLLWRGNEKKNTMEWLKVSHGLIDDNFLEINNLKDKSGLIWLRLEDFILHVCCKDLDAANKLLQIARTIYKKSCILSASNKIVVEIRGSELVEMPLFLEEKDLFCGDFKWLTHLINTRMKQIWKKEAEFEKQIKNINN